jgi:Protein of unknown function (DUF2892)
MMTNVGVIDRALRLALGLALFGWEAGHYGPPLHWLASWAVTVLAAYPILTGLLRYCPIFAITGISTCAEDV